jgi:hypothetical protein
LAIGARFVFHGQKYEKIAMSMAADEEGCGHIFLGEVEIVPEGVPMLLSPEEAERWKPDKRHWTDHLSPAPGLSKSGG